MNLSVSKELIQKLVHINLLFNNPKREDKMLKWLFGHISRKFIYSIYSSPIKNLVTGVKTIILYQK